MKYLYTLNAVDLVLMPNGLDMVWITPYGTVVTHNEFLCNVDLTPEQHKGLLSLDVVDSYKEGYWVAIGYDVNNVVVKATHQSADDIYLTGVNIFAAYDTDTLAWITESNDLEILHIGLPGSEIQHTLPLITYDEPFDQIMISKYIKREGRCVLAYLRSMRSLIVKRSTRGKMHAFDLEFDCTDVSIDSNSGDIIAWDKHGNGVVIEEGDEVPTASPADWYGEIFSDIFTKDDVHYMVSHTGRVYTTNDLARTPSNSSQCYVVEEGVHTAQIGERTMILESSSIIVAETSFVTTMEPFHIVALEK